jgi:DNA-binding LacI/PurR family transcriptional regulator
MPAHAKYTEVMSVIKRRIREGDYLLNKFPGERKIAEETGVSYMTARRAIIQLLDDKVLVRGPSGALEVHPSFSKRANPAQVVLLYPAFASTYLTQLRGLVSDFAQKQGVALRPVQFIHWDENTLLEAVDQARGVFVIPYGPEIPPRLREPFRENKVVILDGDFSHEGLPSIRLFRDRCIEQVFEHLYKLGHRRIDCINTQNRNPEINRRIELWQRWRTRRSVDGQLWDDPAAVFTDPTAVARRLMARLLDRKKNAASALVGTTCPAAIGAVRASWERGMHVGRDISICAVNIEPPAEFFCPSITGLNTPDLSDVLGRCFEWFFSRNAWKGPRLLEPSDSALFVGESTGRPADAVLAAESSTRRRRVPTARTTVAS